MSAPENTPRAGTLWTEQEDNELRMAWGHHPLKTISARLGRTQVGVYTRAYELGLGLGVPQGFESLFAAAERTGYLVPSLRRILNQFNIPIRRCISHPSCKGARHFVEPYAVDNAIARWCKLETLIDGARRHGVPYGTMKNWYDAEIAAGLISIKPRTAGTHHRLDPAVIDAFVARHRDGTEHVKHGAARHELQVRTLLAWLARAGVERPPGKYWRIDPAVVDRVVEENRKTTTKAWRGRGPRVSAAYATPSDSVSPQLSLAI